MFSKVVFISLRWRAVAPAVPIGRRECNCEGTAPPFSAAPRRVEPMDEMNNDG